MRVSRKLKQELSIRDTNTKSSKTKNVKKNKIGSQIYVN